MPQQKAWSVLYIQDVRKQWQLLSLFFSFLPRRCSLAAASPRDAGCCNAVGLCGLFVCFLFFLGGGLSFGPLLGGNPVERFDRRCQMKK